MFKLIKKLFCKPAKTVEEECEGAFDAWMEQWDAMSYEQQMSHFPESWKQHYPKKV